MNIIQVEYDDEDEIEDEESFVTETESTTISETTEPPESTSDLLTTPAANDDDDVNVPQLNSLTTTEMTNDELEITTELPNIVDNVVRNENEIVKFSPPISTSIIDDSNSDVESSSYASYIIPLKIILPIEHVHKTKENNTFERFNYILLKVDDASYHEHIYSDNSDFLLPVERNTTTPTEKPVFDIENNTEITTNTTNMINSNGREMILDPIQSDENTDTVLVDSQGYRYELGKHYKILNEQDVSIVEFDEIEMQRDKIPNKSHNQISKRILVDDNETIKSTTEQPQKNHLNNEQYEGHYAKIFQWLHYHL